MTTTIKANVKKLSDNLYYEDMLNPWYVRVGASKVTFPSWEAAAAQLPKLAATAALFEADRLASRDGRPRAIIQR